LAAATLNKYCASRNIDAAQAVVCVLDVGVTGEELRLKSAYSYMKTDSLQNTESDKAFDKACPLCRLD